MDASPTVADRGWRRACAQIISLTQASVPSGLQFIAERYYNTIRRDMDRTPPPPSGCVICLQSKPRRRPRVSPPPA
jgi:hypothetical protein